MLLSWDPVEEEMQVGTAWLGLIRESEHVYVLVDIRLCKQTLLQILQALPCGGEISVPVCLLVLLRILIVSRGIATTTANLTMPGQDRVLGGLNIYSFTVGVRTVI